MNILIRLVPSVNLRTFGIQAWLHAVNIRRTDVREDAWHVSATGLACWLLHSNVAIALTRQRGRITKRETPQPALILLHSHEDICKPLNEYTIAAGHSMPATGW